MIDIYIKSGFVYAGKKGRKSCKKVIALTIASSRFKRSKTLQINDDITRFKLEATAVIFALGHIKDKFRKKDIRIHTDSHFLIQMAQRDAKSGEFVCRTKLQAIEWMRDTIMRYPNLRIVKLNHEHPLWTQTAKMYDDCGFDDIMTDHTE